MMIFFNAPASLKCPFMPDGYGTAVKVFYCVSWKGFKGDVTSGQIFVEDVLVDYGALNFTVEDIK